MTATSQSGKAFLEGGIRTGGFETSALTRQNFEAVDSAELVPGGVDFDLAVFAGTGLFDRFSFRVDAAADLTVSGDFDVVFTGPVDRVDAAPVDPPVDPPSIRTSQVF